MREAILAERGTGGYRQYRIPALVVLPSGRVLAAYDGRATVDDLPGPIDVVCRHSDDNGLSWSPQRVLRGGHGLEGFGDPSLLVDAETGRVFAFYAATRLAGFFESRVGADDAPDVEQCDVSFSDDGGLTWQHRRLTPCLKDLDIAAMFAASGMGIQVATGPYAGRLVQPYVVRRASGGIWATMVFSDDHGETWRHGELVGPGANENTVACLSDGTLLLHSRATPHRLVARSTDGGESWSGLSEDLTLVDPGDNGSLARLDHAPTFGPAEGDDLVCTHNDDPDLRRRVVLRHSPDGGRSWPREAVVYGGSSAYSTACRLADGAIGVLYEREGYTQVVFTRVDPDELLPAQPEAPGQLTVALRMIDTARPTETDGSWAIGLDDEALWGPREWREIAAVHVGRAEQRIWPREALDAALGPAAPGLRAGDVLVFSLRVTNTSGAHWPAVSVVSDAEVDATPFALEPGQSRVVMGVRRTVTPSDVAAGVCTCRIGISGSSGEHVQVYSIDTPTGRRRD